MENFLKLPRLEEFKIKGYNHSILEKLCAKEGGFLSEELLKYLVMYGNLVCFDRDEVNDINRIIFLDKDYYIIGEYHVFDDFAQTDKILKFFILQQLVFGVGWRDQLQQFVPKRDQFINWMIELDNIPKEFWVNLNNIIMEKYQQIDLAIYIIKCLQPF